MPCCELYLHEWGVCLPLLLNVWVAVWALMSVTCRVWRTNNFQNSPWHLLALRESRFTCTQCMGKHISTKCGFPYLFETCFHACPLERKVFFIFPGVTFHLVSLSPFPRINQAASSESVCTCSPGWSCPFRMKARPLRSVFGTHSFTHPRFRCVY